MDRPVASPEPLVAKVVRKYETKRTNQSRHPTMWNSWGELDEDSVVTDFYLWGRDHAEFFQGIWMFGVVYRAN